MSPCIVIPVHNRRATTLTCLHALEKEGTFDWAHVVIVDDGSTDGTAEAIRSEFPQVTILTGDGNLWWGGGINMGMKWAFESGASSVLWLNDDTFPRKDALRLLVQKSAEYQAITTAQCVLRETDEMHYGGLLKTSTGTTLITCPPDEILPCDTICGNCVCIPLIAFEKIGLIDTDAFPHFAGDADYGLRAQNAGVSSLIVGSAICDCSYGSAGNRQSWLYGNLSVPALWRQCLHPYNGILSRCGRTFRLRHWGLRGGLWLLQNWIKLVLISLIKVVIPRPLLLRLGGHKNTTHQRMQAVQKWEAGQPVPDKAELPPDP